MPGDAVADARRARRRSAPFTPGVAKDYTASTTANVISTAGDAALTSPTRAPLRPPGQRRVLAAAALKAAAAGGRAPPRRSAFPLTLDLQRPVSNDAVTVGFTQPIGATDALRTGTYSKTLTFTLSTTTP